MNNIIKNAIENIAYKEIINEAKIFYDIKGDGIPTKTLEDPAPYLFSKTDVIKSVSLYYCFKKFKNNSFLKEINYDEINKNTIKKIIIKRLSYLEFLIEYEKDIEYSTIKINRSEYYDLFYIIYVLKLYQYINEDKEFKNLYELLMDKYIKFFNILLINMLELNDEDIIESIVTGLIYQDKSIFNYYNEIELNKGNVDYNDYIPYDLIEFIISTYFKFIYELLETEKNGLYKLFKVLLNNSIIFSINEFNDKCDIINYLTKLKYNQNKSTSLVNNHYYKSIKSLKDQLNETKIYNKKMKNKKFYNDEIKKFKDNYNIVNRIIFEQYFEDYDKNLSKYLKKIRFI